jgi:hypothetical protein
MDRDKLAPYAGREQASVKHFLLESYLARLTMITAQGGYSQVCGVAECEGPFLVRQQSVVIARCGRSKTPTRGGLIMPHFGGAEGCSPIQRTSDTQPQNVPAIDIRAVQGCRRRDVTYAPRRPKCLVFQVYIA